MSEDLQSLLNKINRDGVEKAQGEAEKILAKARSDAAAIVQSAKNEAAAKMAEAAKAAEADAARAAKTISQAARDTIIDVQKAITAMLEKLLAQNVDKALGNEKAVADLAAKVVENFVTTGDVEVSAAGKLAAALKAVLAAKGAFKVVTDETIGKGFCVKVDGGRVEHAFTGAVIAEELSRRLRPDLAKLVKA